MLLGIVSGDPSLSVVLFGASLFSIPASAFVRFRSARERARGQVPTLGSQVGAFSVGWLAMLAITAVACSIAFGLLWASAQLFSLLVD